MVGDREDATTISTLQTDKWGVGGVGVGLTSDKQQKQPTNPVSGVSWTRTHTVSTHSLRRLRGFVEKRKKTRTVQRKRRADLQTGSRDTQL